MELAGNTFAATFVDGLVMDGGSDLEGEAIPRAVFFNSAAPFDLSGTGHSSTPRPARVRSQHLHRIDDRRSPSAGRRTARLRSVVLHGTIISEVPNTLPRRHRHRQRVHQPREHPRIGNAVSGRLPAGHGRRRHLRFAGQLFNSSATSWGPLRTGGLLPLGNMLLTGGGFVDNPVLFEAMSRDVGTTAAARPELPIQHADRRTRYTRLVDQSDNAPGTEPEAVYADSLYVSETSTLDLNGPFVRAARPRPRHASSTALSRDCPRGSRSRQACRRPATSLPRG